MRSRSRKALLSFVVMAGVAVVVVAGFALQRPILEQWHMWKLDSDDVEEKHAAIEKLGEMRESIDALTARLAEEYGERAIEALSRVRTRRRQAMPR